MFCLIKMLRKCQHSRGGVNKKKSWYARHRSFSACNREQLCKTSPPFDKDTEEVRVKGRRLTHLYRRWGQLCSCIEGYCCSQDIAVPRAHMMNESPCNRSSWLALSLQQTNNLPPHCDHLCASATRKAFTWFPFINSLEQEIISKCLSQLLISSHHAISLETI